MNAADVIRIAPRGWPCRVVRDEPDHIEVHATVPPPKRGRSVDWIRENIPTASILTLSRGEVCIIVQNGRVSGETLSGASWVDPTRWRWEGRVEDRMRSNV